MATSRIRALITGAGTGSSGNVVRALRAMRPVPHIVGVHSDRFTLRQSLADRSYLCPPVAAETFVPAVLDIVKRQRINVVMPGDDDAVKALSDHRRRFPMPLFLPRRATIDLCQDKYALCVFLRRRRIPAPLTYALRSLEGLAPIFARFSRKGLLWCRARRGSRSVAATPVATVEQARGWITQWRDLRGVKISDFTLSEYLPGRHFIVQSVWREGRLLLAQATEVLSYFAAGNNPSGSFSLSSLAKTVVAPEALQVTLRAVRAIEKRPSGTFFVELKEAAGGVPCVTEINAGRFPSGVTALLALGRHNMVAVFVLAALGEPVTIDDPYGSSEDHYLVRDIDAVPGVYSAAELSEGIRPRPAAPEADQSAPCNGLESEV
jgi:carbamoyl-phosphate synthase large subunit